MKTQRLIWFFVMLSLLAFRYKYDGFPEEIGGHYFLHHRAPPESLTEVSMFVFFLRCHVLEIFIWLVVINMLIPPFVRWLKSRKSESA